MEPESSDSLILISSPNESPNTHLELNASSSSKPRRKYRTTQTKLLFISTTAAAKYEFIKHRILSGSSVNTSSFSTIVSTLKKAKLYSLTMPDHSVVYQNMVGEFYGNFKMEKGILGDVYITTCVTGRHLMIDEFCISKILKLPAKQMKTLKSENEKDLVFNKDEFLKYLKVLCSCDVPDLVFKNDVVVSSDYFSITSQFLAQVFRENIMPKHPQDKFFNFFKLKCLHDIYCDISCSNVSNFMLSQMIKANNLGYMAYRMFLTELFDYFAISFSNQPHMHVHNSISTDSVTLGKVLTQSALGYPKETVPNVHTIADVVTLIKGVKDDVARLSTVTENHVENQSFMLSTIESMNRRLDSIEERLGLHEVYPQDLVANSSESYMLNPYGSFTGHMVEVPSLPMHGPMMVNSFEGLPEYYRVNEVENHYVVTDNYYIQPLPPYFNPIFSDQVMGEAA